MMPGVSEETLKHALLLITQFTQEHLGNSIGQSSLSSNYDQAPIQCSKDAVDTGRPREGTAGA